MRSKVDRDAVVGWPCLDPTVTNCVSWYCAEEKMVERPMIPSSIKILSSVTLLLICVTEVVGWKGYLQRPKAHISRIAHRDW